MKRTNKNPAVHPVYQENRGNESNLRKRNPTRLLRWDSFSERKYIPHNVQGSYLRVMVTRTGIEPMLPP